jgi:hypothetical protein
MSTCRCPPERCRERTAFATYVAHFVVEHLHSRVDAEEGRVPLPRQGAQAEDGTERDEGPGVEGNHAKGAHRVSVAFNFDDVQSSSDMCGTAW